MFDSKIAIAIYCLLVGAAIISLLKIIFDPSLKYHSFAYKIKQGIIFWVGRLHYVGPPGFISWRRHYPGLTAADIREADKACQPGDVGLHREVLVASNWGIPGAFKHVWLMVDGTDCIEAVQEGVLRRDRIEPLKTDYVAILRPKGVSKDDIKEAIARAETIKGCEYDANFKFDLGEGLEKDYTSNISSGNFHLAFSCTETVGFAWYRKRDHLKIFRSEYAGREAIVADDFFKMNFDIIYLSPNVTVEWAKKNGLHEQGRVKIEQYWAQRAKTNK